MGGKGNDHHPLLPMADFVVAGRPGPGPGDGPGPGAVVGMGTPVLTRPGVGTPFTEDVPAAAPSPLTASKIGTKDGSVTLDVQVSRPTTVFPRVAV